MLDALTMLHGGDGSDQRMVDRKPLDQPRSEVAQRRWPNEEDGYQEAEGVKEQRGLALRQPISAIKFSQYSRS